MPQGTPIPFLLIGGVLSLIALVLVLRTLTFVIGSRQTTGTIVGSQVRHSRSRKHYVATYAPRVRYVVDGESFEHTSNVSSSSASFEEGSEVTIRYNPNAPYEARIDGFRYLWLAPTILGLFGAPCIAVAVMMILNAR